MRAAGCNYDGAGGFSLIEVLCAILVLGVAMVALTQGMTTALRSSKEAETQTAAALLAAAQIESIRADGFVVDGETDGDGDGELSSYHWVQSVSSTDIDGLHSVKVVVEHSASGQAIFELQTLIFDWPITPSDNGTQKGSASRKERNRK